MKVSAIITAAGMGKRMGGETPKQFLELAGRPILLHTLDKFAVSDLVNSVVITTEANRVDETVRLIEKCGYLKEWRVVAGGSERQDSVFAGLLALPDDTDIVVVHDGVRPFVTTELIDHSIMVAQEEGGCIVAIPVKDTLKRGGDDRKTTETVDRKNLWAAQTPQTFQIKILRSAFDNAKKTGFYGTDEASLVEKNGGKVALLQGSSLNIKITTPDDMVIAEAIIGVSSHGKRQPEAGPPLAEKRGSI